MSIFDMLLANAMGESGGGGGGGSSDFSTATVTLVDNVGDGINFVIPYVCEANAMGEGSPAMIYSASMTYEAGTYTVALYKGALMCEIVYSITTTGDITNLFENMYLITGDCTITITA